MNFCCTDKLIEKEGLLYFHPARTWVSQIPEGNIVTDMHEHPDVFERTLKDGTVQLDLGLMWRGSGRLPAFSYEPETDVFTPIESWKTQWGRHAIRRRIINEDLERDGVKLQTELKKMRKLLKLLVAAHPELAGHPEVTDFESLSNFIEGTVSHHEKDTERAEVEARKHNCENDDWWMGR